MATVLTYIKWQSQKLILEKKWKNIFTYSVKFCKQNLQDIFVWSIRMNKWKNLLICDVKVESELKLFPRYVKEETSKSDRTF